MSDTKSAQRPRPLSPHIGVYRWGPHMLASIVHRATGSALAVGTIILTWWLVAAASGEDAYATFTAFIGSPIGRIILFGLTLALFQHLLSGLRHLYLDTGAGYEIRGNRRMAAATFILSPILTLLVWAYGYGLI